MISAHIPLDPALLPALAALLEERHVSRAGRRIGLTQSAMSRVLARLRSELGDPLLVRAGRSLVLSPRAERLQRPLRAALDGLAQLLANDGEFDPLSSRRSFRIATVDYGTAIAVVPLLRILAREAPGLSLNVEPLRSDFDDALQSGALDLVVAPARRSSAGLVWSKLCTDRFVTVAREGHPRLNRTLTLSAYCKLSHVVVVPEQRAGNPIDTLLAQQGHQRHVALRVSSFLAGPLAVSESDLVLTTPESLARKFAPGFGLQIHTTPLALAPLTLSLAWHERQRADPGHAFLRERMLRAVAGPR